MSPQCEEVLSLMRSRPMGVTQVDALHIGCLRLASRISDLKREGYPIYSKIETVTKANGKRVNIARYFLVEIKGDFQVEVEYEDGNNKKLCSKVDG